jgi:hypothetical protein
MDGIADCLQKRLSLCGLFSNVFINRRCHAVPFI